MVQFADYSFAYFVGIGGIGMSALARLLAMQGYQVFGYDRIASPLVLQLRKEGIGVYCDDAPASIPSVIRNHPSKTLVIYTPAIPAHSSILSYFSMAGYRLQSRAEVIGLISRQLPTIAVAGTHGKTTVSAMIAHILYESHIPMVAFIGGIINLYDSNLIHNCSLSQVKMIVAEADEFNRSFLHLTPTCSVVTAADADHPETYSVPALMEDSFRQFIKQTQQNLLIHHTVADKLQLRENCHRPFRTYALYEGDITAGNVYIAPHQSAFDYLGCGVTISNMVLPMPGSYNIENALAAITVCLELGIAQEQIRRSIACFPGIQRRFYFVFKNDQCVLIDDYAHHPVEVSALLTSVKKMYPNSAITAIFQPHLFSRTAAFYEAFASSLSIVDQVFLLPIYPAREEPIPGVTSQLIFDKLTCKRKKLVTIGALLTELAAYTIKEHQVIVTIGAGDIGEAVPAIAAVLQHKT